MNAQFRRTYPILLCEVAAIASRKSGLLILLTGISSPKKARAQASSTTAWGKLCVVPKHNLDCFVAGESLDFSNSLARLRFFISFSFAILLFSTSAVNRFFTSSGADMQTRIAQLDISGQMNPCFSVLKTLVT